jgi:hypothetical protein
LIKSSVDNNADKTADMSFNHVLMFQVVRTSFLGTAPPTRCERECVSVCGCVYLCVRVCIMCM